MALKPRLLIALPSIRYGPVVARTLNSISLAESLRPFFDVTIAYHQIADDVDIGFPTLSIVPEIAHPEQRRNAYISLGKPHVAAKYILQLQQFARRYANDFDAVLERQWQFAGAFANAFRGPNRVVAVTLEGEYYGNFAERQKQQPLLKRLITNTKRQILFGLRRHWLDTIDFALMETEEVRRVMVERGLVSADKTYELMPMGVDPAVFYPTDQLEARRALGLNPDHLILTYAGSLNRWTQEPGPLIEAFCRYAPDHVRLHLVGDGQGRANLEKLAAPAGDRIRFFGRCPQKQVAAHITAADLCVAPYNIDRFVDRRFTSASLKIVEYLACGRPVLTIPSSHTAHMIAHGRHGYMVENTTSGLASFLRLMPDREELERMRHQLERDLAKGTLRREGKALTWSDIAGTVASAYMAAATLKQLKSPDQELWARPAHDSE